MKLNHLATFVSAAIFCVISTISFAAEGQTPPPPDPGPGPGVPPPNPDPIVVDCNEHNGATLIPIPGMTGTFVKVFPNCWIHCSGQRIYEEGVGFLNPQIPGSGREAEDIVHYGIWQYNQDGVLVPALGGPPSGFTVHPKYTQHPNLNQAGVINQALGVVVYILNGQDVITVPFQYVIRVASYIRNGQNQRHLWWSPSLLGGSGGHGVIQEISSTWGGSTLPWMESYASRFADHQGTTQVGKWSTVFPGIVRTLHPDDRCLVRVSLQYQMIGEYDYIAEMFVVSNLIAKVEARAGGVINKGQGQPIHVFGTHLTNQSIPSANVPVSLGGVSFTLPVSTGIPSEQGGDLLAQGRVNNDHNNVFPPNTSIVIPSTPVFIANTAKATIQFSPGVNVFNWESVYAIASVRSTAYLGSYIMHLVGVE